MKKPMFLLLALILACSLIFTGCRRERGDEVFTITIASPSSPIDNTVRGFFHFQELVEERSGGRIRVNVAHSAQLGDSRDYMEQMQMGAIEAAEVNVAVMSAFDPTFMVFELPYVSRSVEHLRGLLDGGLQQRFSDSLESRTGVKVLSFMIRSPRNMYISTRPVRTVEDFAGMRVRIMESPVHHRTFELLGAVPIPISASERFMALQTGVADAAENSVQLIVAQSEYEVTRYLSLTEHFIAPNVFAMSARFFNSLPADLQEIVRQAGEEAARYTTRLDLEGDAEAIRFLTERGMIVNHIYDKTPFVERVRPIFDEFRGQIGGDLLDAFTG